MKIGQALFHFDFSENYPFVPQDEIQSRHWDHGSYTLFTAMVHFKYSKDNLLKKKPFGILSDYMNHSKYAVSKFLDIISDEFSKSQPDLVINERFLHSDGTAQPFKQKYSLCTMTFMDGNVECDFSATSHGKGDINDLGSTCMRKVREKTLARTIDPQNSIDFAACAAAVCLGIIILHCSKADAGEVRATRDNSWHTDNGTIYSIPDTRKAHYFRKVIPYTIGFQTITSDVSDYAEFWFRPGKFVQKDKTIPSSLTETPVFNYKQGQ